MSVVKSSVFQPSDSAKRTPIAMPQEAMPEAVTSPRLESLFTMSQKNDELESEALKGNRLAKLSHQKNVVMKTANLLKRHTDLMASCIISGFPEDDLISVVGEISVFAMNEMGFDMESQTQSAQAMAPVFLRSSTELVKSLCRSGKFDSVESLREQAKTIAKTMVSVARNKTLSQFAQEAYPNDLHERMALRSTMVAALGVMASEVARFSFLQDFGKTMKHVSGTLGKAFENNMDAFFADQASTSAYRMLSQSLLTNLAEIYATGWRQEADRILPRLHIALKNAEAGPEARQKLMDYMKSRLQVIDREFIERSAMIVGLAAAHSSELAQKGELKKSVERQKNN